PVSLDVLGLLSEVAEERPLLCVVDDAQWLDQASADSLVFVARRLDADRLVLLFAARSGAARAFAARGLPELRLGPLGTKEARALLLVAACEEAGERATVARAAAELGLDPGVLSVAEAQGLVGVGRDRIEFCHPLMRSAVYRGAGFAERERSHRALAAVLADPGDADRRAWHRAAACRRPGARHRTASHPGAAPVDAGDRRAGQ